MKLSIVIPVFNSSKIIIKLIKSIKKNIKKNTSFEIILINDYSEDSSWKTIKSLAKKYKFVKGINLNENYGQHYAIFAGLKFAKGKNIICMDDDMQHDPAYINKITNVLDKGFDVCYVKYLKRKHSYIKILVSWLNNIVSSFLMSKPINIYTSSYKGFKKKVKTNILKNSGRFVFLDYWMFKYSKKITFIDVKHKKRLYGETNYKFKQLLTLWSNMIFLIDYEKKNYKSIIILFIKIFFRTFLRDYINYKESSEIQIESKTF